MRANAMNEAPPDSQNLGPAPEVLRVSREKRSPA
jgi:hypothetical protein